MKGNRTKRATGLDPALKDILPAGRRYTSSVQIASLWSSYGKIYRIAVEPDEDGIRSLVLKHIHPPYEEHASISHLRKLKSYAVERYFYSHLASRLPPSVKVATYHAMEAPGTLLLEDLSEQYSRPAWGSLGMDDTLTVLRWLGGFHGTFWGCHGTVPPPVAGEQARLEDNVSDVWQQGTYYYLDTRREEHSEAVEDGEGGFVLPWAEKVNSSLAAERAAGRCTLLHGDAKGANIMFSASGACALVDFQYVGSGVPTLDIVYFLGTSVKESLLRGDGETTLLKLYHSALVAHGNEYSWETFQWHWQLAVVDWVRFMAGWGFWGNDVWVVRRAREIVDGWEKNGFEMQ